MKRLENESFEKYKKRRKFDDKNLKLYLRHGRVFWDNKLEGKSYERRFR